jgi:hypothetical protein
MRDRIGIISIIIITMLYVFATYLTSMDDCGDAQCSYVLKTEDMDIAQILKKLKYDNMYHPCINRSIQDWDAFTDKERKVVDELFSYHPTLEDELDRWDFFQISTRNQAGDKHRPITFESGDVGIVLTIDDFNEN